MFNLRVYSPPLRNFPQFVVNYEVSQSAWWEQVLFLTLCAYWVLLPLILSLKLGSFLTSVQYSAQYSRRTYCISLGFSLCADLSSVALLLVNFKCVEFSGLWAQSQLREPHQDFSQFLLSTSWPGNSLKAVSSTVLGLTSIVSQLSEITALHCLIFIVFKAVVSKF